jgi:nitrate/TMAO reductase-like tetraheme cytochrome c subunit
LIKVMTLTLFFLILLFSVGFLGLETTSSSKFCSSCHEMKPEYYTWKASSHSEVDCVNCHTGSSKEDYAKAKANGLVQVFKKATQTYTAPIRMPDQIQDSSCEKCHNIFTRDVTPTGDLTIPHDKHKNEGIKCTQCHQGVAHGKIADRKMTYQADYQKWDDALGKAVMSESKYMKPDMATCMKCHTARKITTECKACHETGMYPDTHQSKLFKLQSHGTHARDDLNLCNSCHYYMSAKEIDGLAKVTTINKFLKKENKAPKLSEFDYAKQNTFCKECHSLRPASHGSLFLGNHGELASKNKEKCLACHNYQQAGNQVQTSIVSCASCHPSMHKDKSYKSRHPVPLAEENQKVTDFCYTCHSENICKTCHK